MVKPLLANAEQEDAKLQILEQQDVEVQVLVASTRVLGLPTKIQMQTHDLRLKCSGRRTFRKVLLGFAGLTGAFAAALAGLHAYGVSPWDVLAMISPQACKSLLVDSQNIRSSVGQLPRFKADGTFRIVQLTDLHIQCFPDTGTPTIATINAVLDAEKPDFVAYTGDVCEGSGISCNLPGLQQIVLQSAFHPAESRGIPWAFLYGNWDRKPEAALSGAETNKFITENFVHTMNRLPPSGVDGDSIFDIPILPPSVTAGDTPWLVLYFFDTHSNDGCMGASGTGCLYPSEVNWYNHTSMAYRQRNGGRAVPALGFTHVPIPEYMQTWNQKSSVHGHLDESEAPLGVGISCVLDSSDLFSAALDNGDILGFTCGHDHDNDFRGNLHGIELMYGRKTGSKGSYSSFGLGAYGPPKSWANDVDGARVIELQYDSNSGSVKMSTWIRLANGSKIDERDVGQEGVGQAIQQTTCNHAA